LCDTNINEPIAQEPTVGACPHPRAGLSAAEDSVKLAPRDRPCLTRLRESLPNQVGTLRVQSSPLFSCLLSGCPVCVLIYARPTQMRWLLVHASRYGSVCTLVSRMEATRATGAPLAYSGYDHALGRRPDANANECLVGGKARKLVEAQTPW